MVSLLARHKLDTLLTEDILDMWQTIDAGNKAAQLCSRTTPGTCTRETWKVGISIAFLYQSSTVVVFIHRDAALVHVVLRLVGGGGPLSKFPQYACRSSRLGGAHTSA